MDIFVPKRKLWIPDNHIADMDLSPPGQDRMLRRNRMRCNLTPDILMMMGAAGSAISGDEISYAFDGTGDWLTVPDHADWDILASSADRTVGFWVRHTNLSANQEVYISHNDGTFNNQWELNHLGGGAGITFATSLSGAALITMGARTAEITDTDWHHIALCKVGSLYGLYVDGALGQYGSDADTGSWNGALYISARGVSATRAPFTGNMDEIRIYNGNPFGASPDAGLTDTITVPTSQHSSDSNTKLLIHCGETKTGTTGSGATFTDSGNTGHTVTENGNAIEDAVNYKF